ncbi:MAG: hypothetical protein ACXWQQ_17295, partial [Pseudobdellovibrio sp.]
MAGNNSLELEISTLFQEGNTLESICNEIISKYEKSDAISPSEIESISHFLTLSGRVDLLFKLYLKCLNRDSLSVFPWGSFAAAAKHCSRNVLDELAEVIEASLNDRKNYSNALKSPDLINSVPSLNIQLAGLKTEFQNERLQTKTKLISQLNHNRLYQLTEQEEQTLQQLVKLFPLDTEVKLLHQAHLEKKADEILIRARKPIARQQPKKIIEIQSQDTVDFVKQVEENLLILATRLQTESPEQIYNMTLLALQLNLYDLSLQLVNMAPRTFASEWLKAEILFESSRYLDLLKHIEMIEQTMTSTPEATYGALYLKAQAYYGLGQKEIAIQLLETLASKVNSYRSTEA